MLAEGYWQSWSNKGWKWPGMPKRDFEPGRGKHKNMMVPKIKVRKRSKITGWCSWYAFGKEINEEKLLDQAEKIQTRKKELGKMEYFLVDDGWCKWGDWLKPEATKFPKGIEGLNNKLREMGFKPGLWLAPFLVERGSEIVKEYPEWLVKNKNGKFAEGWLVTPVDSLIGFSRWMLDIRKPEVHDYLEKTIETAVTKWGVKLLKLDFLYAPYFYPDKLIDFDPRETVSGFMKAIKERHPEVKIIACGCPMEAAVGVAEAIRVSKDALMPSIYGWPKWLKRRIHKHRIGLTGEKMDAWKEWGKVIGLDPDVWCENEEQSGLTKKETEDWKKIWERGRVKMRGDRFD